MSGVPVAVTVLATTVFFISTSLREYECLCFRFSVWSAGGVLLVAWIGLWTSTGISGTDWRLSAVVLSVIAVAKTKAGTVSPSDTSRRTTWTFGLPGVGNLRANFSDILSALGSRYGFQSISWLSSKSPAAGDPGNWPAKRDAKSVAIGVLKRIVSDR